MADNSNNITTISIKATADTSQAQKSLANLTTKLENLKNVAQGTKDIKSSFASIAKSANSISESSVANVKALASALNKVTKINSASLTEIAKALKGIAEASNQISGTNSGLGKIKSTVNSQVKGIKDEMKDVPQKSSTKVGDVTDLTATLNASILPASILQGMALKTFNDVGKIKESLKRTK